MISCVVVAESYLHLSELTDFAAVAVVYEPFDCCLAFQDAVVVEA